VAVETFAVRSKRVDRGRRIQTAQHLLAAAILILTAYGHLTDPKHHDVVLPILEIAAGGALIVTAIVEKVRKTHARVGWLELAGAAMTYVEAFAKLRQPHHLSFHILTFISPTILLLLGLFDSRIRAGMRLETNDDMFYARLRLMRSHRVPWETIRSYRITPTHLELTREDAGGVKRVKRLKLKDLYDRDEANAWLVEQFTRRGVPEASQTPPTASAG
jgi:hypothetical protein